MTQKMRKLFALLMAVMMLCASLPLDALAELVPPAPIEEHSQSAWMYSALGDVAPISADEDENHIVVGDDYVYSGTLDEEYPATTVMMLYHDVEYEAGDDEKLSTSDKVGVGEQAEFIIKVVYIRNSGDVLESGVSFSLNDSDGYEVIYNLSEQMNPGDILEKTYTYTVQPEDVYVNAELTWNGESIKIHVPVEHEMNLEVVKNETSTPAEGDAYGLGEEIEYTIKVTNNSEVYVTDITLDDDKTGESWTIESLEGTTSAASDEERSEEFTTTYTVTEEDILAESVTNTATATGSDPYEEDNVTGNDEETVLTVPGDPQLTAEFSAYPDDGVDLGDTITYTVTVTNIGNLTVNGIEVTDTLNGSYEYISSLGPCFYNEVKGGEYPVTKEYMVTEDDILNRGGSIETTATVTGTASNGEEMNPECEPVTVTLAEPNPALSVEMTAYPPANGTAYALGEEITYTVTVTNTGNLTVKDITVKDPLTEDTWTIKELKPTRSKLTPSLQTFTTKKYTVQEKDILAGEIVNTVTANGTASNNDPATGEGTKTVNTVAQNPALTVSKTADKISGVGLNDVITYTINVKNDGNVTVSNINVNDPLTGLNESVGTLAPGASAAAITTSYTVK